MDLESTMEWNKNFQTNSIFVYNFPNEWMENDLKKNFMIFGTINNIIIDKDINIYAFIQYNDTESSQKAIEVMNGKEINGKLLKVTSRKIVDECIDMNTNKLDSQQKSQSSNDNKKTTLFVFYLPPHWNDQDLFDKFKTFGNLESATVAKKNDKTSKGYGFVVYTDPHSAALAISNMNKVEVYTGKRLKVLLKSNSNETNKRKIKPGCTIFVFYLPNDWSDKDLKRHFSHYGNILGATIKRETNGKSRGYGFINFENQQSAINAVAGMNGFNAGNKYLKVSIKKGEEQYLAPQYLNIDRMNNSYNSPPPPPPPMSCHGNESSNYANNEMYSIQNTMPNNRYNSRVSTNDVHQSFINSQYGHFPYNFFKNNEQGPYMQRSYNKTYNNMGKT
ncbi:putative polyadenylate-binding protein [Plasmodium gaboni]|uniref:Polyadenylate-binding protein, putative n=1 Tax=Plasmodium gaboni TaxID=647221 RepID=A0A151LEJ9_9APIC|nr:putative polyadenylate-binding protein [Plasmodium gaboni]XP_028540273.1 polyadenylate-binding protein, putative [Plasmodium sp. gorilla clade G2]SOV24641.1 polyadenylate-binding protein, putative [Plasmodium sp. DRC-Itaito]KYN97371.1 putative polyadenylate-binding protein [Plasmodium gaboni]SOV18185.1 polyadenylate-binding protein, putative [Plasmodium gaboni]SOV18428.1 polyadenylate-binding protein, putative [Plasmodium sp. gorilla clade G2]